MVVFGLLNKYELKIGSVFCHKEVRYKKNCLERFVRILKLMSLIKSLNNAID